MYKSRLQEICDQNLWSLPTYSSNRDGPDHCPRFRASVFVNGVSFDSSDFYKSSKEAQNDAAKLAFEHFNSSIHLPLKQIHSSSVSSTETIAVKKEISSSSVSVADGREFADVNYMYKSQLQNYAQKKGLSLPVYSSVQEGSPHAPRFKATVTIDGRTLESPEFFCTLKEAEHAAAKAALSSLSTNGLQENDCALFKNLLQDLAKKEGFSIPVYTTTISGASHSPTFTSSVKVEDDIFHGVESKTKKLAELNAAKVAYISLKECQKSRIPAQSGIDEAFEFIYPNSSSSQPSQPNITVDFQLKLNLEGQSSEKTPRNEVHEGIEIIYPNSSSSNSSITIDLEQKLNLKDKGEDVVDSSAEIITKTAEVKAEHHSATLGSSSQDGLSSPTTVLECLERAVTEQNADQKTKTEFVDKDEDVVDSSAEIITKTTEVKAEHHLTTLGSSSQDGSSSPTTVLGCLELAVTEQNADQRTKTECTLLCNRVVVYTPKPDLNVPKGVTMLPISDGQWVAVSVDYPDSSDG